MGPELQPAETARAEVVCEIVSRFNRRDLEGLLERRVVASATHAGEFLGMTPTGRRFTVPECTVFEFRGDLVQNVWVYVDSGSIARQLGYAFAPTGGAS
jgi:hypothetical protein